MPNLIEVQLKSDIDINDIEDTLLDDKVISISTFQSEDIFGQFRPFTVGFDRIFDELHHQARGHNNYPPYNIIKHDSESFAIELAVAGMSKKDITVTKEKSQLIIKGEKFTYTICSY